jgi:hypothetical protein
MERSHAARHTPLRSTAIGPPLLGELRRVLSRLGDAPEAKSSTSCPPTHSPFRTLSEKALILSSTAQTSSTTFLPSLVITCKPGEQGHAGALQGGHSQSLHILNSAVRVLNLGPAHIRVGDRIRGNSKLGYAWQSVRTGCCKCIR